MSIFLEQFPNISVIGQETNISNWEELYPNTPVCLVLLNLPDLQDLENLITERTSRKIVCLATNWTTALANIALQKGVLGCIAGDSTAEEFLSVIKQAIKGEQALSPKLATQLFLNMLPGEKSGQETSYEDLSTREKEVLSWICQGLSNKQIAQRMYLSVRTIDNHVANIFSKLHINTRTEAAVLALNLGWVKLPKANQVS
ncbi:MAG TPA: response regulator transcription factor [Anaerolineales bacterium]|nr:response regulator transcription factor [Anaerolineales bacterium]